MNPGEGAVTCLQLIGPANRRKPSHLICGGADGLLSVFQAEKEWRFMKALTGHRGGVLDLSVHPSGRAALSIARYGEVGWKLGVGDLGKEFRSLWRGGLLLMCL